MCSESCRIIFFSGQKVRDKEFVDTILRKLILEKIVSVFPYLKDNKLSQNTLCAKLLKCIEDSKPVSSISSLKILYTIYGNYFSLKFRSFKNSVNFN